MMGRRQRLKGSEWDLFGGWKRVLCYMKKPGVSKKMKKGMNKRMRKEANEMIAEQLNELTNQ